ncbi:MAG: hypothetical protein NTV77_03840 [Candidatus Azambacteria bacterium]|nr:hypothetical protein [Candidatus Azambacteria bacterium]
METQEVKNVLLAEAMRRVQPRRVDNVGTYNDGGPYSDGYGDEGYGDQSYGEGPAG